MMRATARREGWANGTSEGPPGSGDEWEMRPGGMLVQKRNPDSDRHAAPPPPNIRVRVKHGSLYHEISITSTASFGDLKKQLTGPTGLHHEDQKLIYKDKERDSKAFLDVVGVKDRSKIVLVEDPLSQERRLLEMRRNAKTDKASKSVSGISLEIDRLASQVSAMESIISGGGKVAETDVLTLIELLMNQLLKLDAIIAYGDVKLQRKMQVRRVQKYVETLDMLKIRNSAGTATPNGQKSASALPNTPRHSHSSSSTPRDSTSGTVVTTQWETFDAIPPLIPIDSSNSSSKSQPTITNKFNWEFFE